MDPEADQYQSFLANDVETSSDYSLNGQPRRRNKLVLLLGGLSLLLLILLIVFIAWVAQLKNSSSGGGGNGNGGMPASYTQLGENMKAVRNTKVNPCDNFYEYACGTWLKNTVIPPAEKKFSKAFYFMGQNNEAYLKNISTADWPMIGPLYQSCMDTSALDAKPITETVGPVLATLDGLASKDLYFGVLGDLAVSHGVDNLFVSMGPIVDAKDPTKTQWDIGQGGLSLPSHSMYTDSFKGNFTLHVSRFFTYANINQAQADSMADAVWNIEKAIAGITLPAAAIRDPYKVYNNVTFATLNAAPYNGVSWEAWFVAMNITTTSLDANLEVPSFVSGISAQVDALSLADMVAYAKYHVLRKYALYLQKDFRDEYSRFYDIVVGQAQAGPTRNKVCISLADNLLGDVLGRYYVQQAFAGSSRVKVQEMIDLVKQAFANNLPSLKWMTAATQAAAHVKLDQVVDLVGYPSKWDTYTPLPGSGQLVADNLFNNVHILRQYGYEKVVQRLYMPVNKFRWQMTTPTVNAYYDPSYNTINFPAGILQPTYFSQDYPSYSNYGGIGMVMGHELSHGFDDQGSLYDGTGRLHTWWDKQSTDGFDERANCLRNQYSGFSEEIDGKAYHINGSLTLGENIADNGGIKFAFEAYQLHIANEGNKAEPSIIKGLSPEQLYFLSFAQGWCTKTRPAEAILRLETDPHSPAYARVNGPLMNYDEFAKAWNCPKGSYMNPENQCHLF